MIDACELAKVAGATYVARWTSAHPRPLMKAMIDAMNHKGFSFLEVMVQCPTQAGRYMHGTADPAKLLRLIKDSSVKMAKAQAMTPAEMKGKFVVGEFFRDEEKPELGESLMAIRKNQAEVRP